MNERHARYETFLAVAESGSITAAAKRLYVTQPAVSAEIAQLERLLSVRLFHRGARGVTLTEEGRILYEYVAKGLSFLSAGEEKLKERVSLRRGLLRIGASETACATYLLDRLADFRQRYPGVQVDLRTATSYATCDALRAGQIDIGLLGFLPQGDEFTVLPVAYIEDILVAGEEHELSHRKTVEREDLLSATLLLPPTDSATYAHMAAYFGDLFPKMEKEILPPSLRVASALRGMGVGVTSAAMAGEDLCAGRLVRLAVKPPIPRRRLYVAHLRHLPLSAAAGRLLSHLKEEA